MYLLLTEADPNRMEKMFQNQLANQSSPAIGQYFYCLVQVRNDEWRCKFLSKVTSKEMYSHRITNLNGENLMSFPDLVMMSAS